MTLGWSVFIAALVVVNVGGCAWLILWSSKMQAGEGETTGHVWDGDLTEGNNPLPRWWLGLFWITIVFGIGYAIAFPSLGSFSLLGWSQAGQYEREIARAEQTYGRIFAAFAETPVEQLAHDPAALAAGRNLFVNNCAQCHGSDARGARGFPNLTDDEWLWGGSPDAIETTIARGRTGVMPPFGAALDEPTRELLADYVLHLAGRDVDESRVAEAQPKFAAYCSACHGPTGQGNNVLGAPALANEVWLHGSSRSVIYDVITNGRTNTMPTQEPWLGEDRVHVLAAYVRSLSSEDDSP
jgi:cytochrome c oxidase cbb3-type subunit 3